MGRRWGDAGRGRVREGVQEEEAGAGGVGRKACKILHQEWNPG